MATFQEMKARYENPQQKGFIENVYSTMTSPFRRALEAAQYAGSAPGEYTPMFKSSSLQDIEAGMRKPTEQVLKSVAQAGSFLIPGGGGQAATRAGRIGTAALRGAGAGALTGYGTSETGEELGSTLKAGASGAALGAAFQGLGELGKMKKAGKFQKTKTKPSYTVKEVLGQEPGTISSVGGKENADRIVEVLEDTTRGDNRWLSPEDKQIKFKTNTPNQRLDAAEQLKPLLAEKTTKVAALSDKAVSVAQVERHFMEGDDMVRQLNELARENKGKGGYGWVGEMNQKIAKIFRDNSTEGIMSTSQLNKAVQQLDDLAPTFSKLEKGGTKQLDYLRRVRNSVRGDLGVLEPALNYPKEIYALLMDATPAMERLASQSQRGLRFFGTEWPLTGEILRPIMDTITRKANVVRSGVGNVPSSVMSGLGSLGNTGFIQGGAPVSAMVNVGSQLGSLFNREEEPQAGSQAEPRAGISSLYGAMGAQQPQYTVRDALAEAYQMMPNANASQLTTLAKMLLDENSGGAGGGTVDTENINNVQQALSMLDQYSGIAGKLPTATGKVGEFFGSASEGTAYRALISRIRSSVLKQMIGATQTEAEMKNLRESLPQVTDAPAVAKIKLQMLLNSLYSGSAGSGGTSGYSNDIENISSGY